jgi:putative membrane protein
MNHVAMHQSIQRKVPPLIWLLLFGAVLLWSAINPKDRLTWWLEVMPALFALLLVIVTRQRFPLTPLCYNLILVHSIIVMVGGHYTYAEVPLFDQIANWLGSSRNNYDKVGHFAQGFTPAIIARELLLRKRVVNGNGWRVLFVISFCLALSAFYELIEWWVALLSKEAAESFLGTQGYVWDTQSDMLLALIGAICALSWLTHIHDRQLKRLG